MTNDVLVTMEPSDQSLIAKIREGDGIAAEGLYRSRGAVSQVFGSHHGIGSVTDG